MRLQIHSNLSVHLVDLLTERGHDIEHVCSLGMSAAGDGEILQAPAADDRTIVSAGSGFGVLLAVDRKSKPSYVLLRRTNGRRAVDLRLGRGLWTMVGITLAGSVQGMPAASGLGAIIARALAHLGVHALRE